MEEFCAEIGQTEPHVETVGKKPKKVKKLKTVKFAVETMGTNDETVQEQVEGFKNCNDKEQVEGFKKRKDQERVEGCKIAMDAYDGLSSEIQKWSSMEKWTSCGTRRDH